MILNYRARRHIERFVARATGKPISQPRLREFLSCQVPPLSLIRDRERISPRRLLMPVSKRRVLAHLSRAILRSTRLGSTGNRREYDLPQPFAVAP